MHKRGMDMEIRFDYPTGESQLMLNLPHCSYLWQTIYLEKKPLRVPKDTRVSVRAHWDNSVNNPLNPDPTATVRWGDQRWDGMLVPFVGVLVEKRRPRQGDEARKGKAAAMKAAP